MGNQDLDFLLTQIDKINQKLDENTRLLYVNNLLQLAPLLPVEERDEIINRAKNEMGIRPKTQELDELNQMFR